MISAHMARSILVSPVNPLVSIRLTPGLDSLHLAARVVFPDPTGPASNALNTKFFLTI